MTPSRRSSQSSGAGASQEMTQERPALPGEEDNTFTMDAFWADLGVDIPPPDRRASQGGDNNYDENDLNMDDDEDDFEL